MILVQRMPFCSECVHLSTSENEDRQWLSQSFNSLKEEVLGKCDPTVLPCQRQLLQHIDDGASHHEYTSVEDFYRCEYFQIIDNIKGILESFYVGPKD